MFFNSKDIFNKNFKLIQRFLLENNTKKVRSLTNKLSKVKTLTKEQLFELSKIYTQINELEKAYITFKKIITDEKSQSTNEIKFFSILCFKLEKYEECLEYAEQYLKTEPNNLNILNISLEAKISLNMLFSAIETINKILRLQKNIFEFNELKFLKSKLLFDIEKLDESEKNILELLNTDEKNINYLLLLASIYREKKMEEELITLLNKIYILNQDISIARELVSLYMDNKKYTELKKFFLACSNPDIFIKTNYIHALIFLQNYEEALERINQFLIQDKENFIFYELKIKILQKQRLFNEAIDVLNNAIDAIQISDLNAIKNLKEKTYIQASEYYSKQEKYTLALEFLLEAVKYSTKNSILHYQFALIYYKTQDFNKAIFNLNQAIEIDPNNHKFYNLYSIIYYESDNIQKAIYYALEAVKTSPKNIYMLSKLANLYAHEEEYEKALIYYRKANILQPDNIDIKYNVALCLQKLQNHEESKILYLEILNSNPEHIFAKNNLRILNLEK